jgi:uncharacterized protein with PQ loop repeat
MLALIATIYGLGSAAGTLLQARHLLRRRRSCDLSALLFAIYLGGYVVWLAYGVMVSSVPLVLVNAAGGVSVAMVLGVALGLRGSIWRPRAWGSCPA